MRNDKVTFLHNGGSFFELNEISSRSRTVWDGTPGYFEGYLEQSRYLVEIDDDYMKKNWVWVGSVTNVGKPEKFGFFGLKVSEDQKKVLDHLWIEPKFIKKGLGRQLFQKAVDIARSLGWHSFLIYADPPAEGFYLKMGAVRIGQVESRISGGPIFPVLEMKI